MVVHQKKLKENDDNHLFCLMLFQTCMTSKEDSLINLGNLMVLGHADFHNVDKNTMEVNDFNVTQNASWDSSSFPH